MGGLLSRLSSRRRRRYRGIRYYSTPQAEAFKQSMGKLVFGLQNPDVFAIHLYSADLISEATRNEVLVMSLPTDRKNIILLKAVEAQIKLSPNKFDEFVEILARDPAMNNLAEILRVAYRNLVQGNDHQPESIVDANIPAARVISSTTGRNTSRHLRPSSSLARYTPEPPTTMPPAPSRPLHHTSTSHLVAKYAEHLKAVYRSRALPVDSKWPPSPSKKYINLAAIKKEDINRAEADQFTKATLHGNIDQIMKKKDPIAMEDILEVNDECKCILVEGAPGVGKSTFAWELCRNWEKLVALKRFDIVQLVQLRDPTTQKAKRPSDLFHHDDRRVLRAVREEVISSGGKKLLLVLDGFDELPTVLCDQASVFMKIINGLSLPNATLIITSRPSASGILLAFARVQISKHIEILGFLPEQITEYAESIFTDADDFLQYIHSNPCIHSMMYIPLNCVIVSEIYRENKAAGKFIPNTLTRLYTELSKTLIRRHIVNKGIVTAEYCMPTNLQDLPNETYQCLLALCKLAFTGICNDQQLTFNECDFPPEFDHLGFMNKVACMYISQGVPASLNFLHLTLQEYLAAFYISLLSSDIQKTLFSEGRSKQQLKMVWQFVAGITKFDAVGWVALCTDMISENESENQVQNKEFEFENSFLTNCLYEAQDSQMCKDVFSQTKKTLVYNPTIATPFDLYTTGYCIANSEAVWKVYTSTAAIATEEVAMFVAGLNSASEVTGYIDTLSFSYNHFGHIDCQHLSNLNPEILGRISTILLGDCNMDGMACDVLSTTVPLMKNLQELDLVNNPICKGGFQKLFCALMNNARLCSLDITDNRLGSKDFGGLQSLIEPSGTLRQLKIGCDDMNTECTRQMLRTTLMNSSLKQLEIYNANLDCATKELTQLLGVNDNIISFQLYPCSSKTAVSIARALQTNHTLKTLKLGDAQEGLFAEITLEGAEALAEMTRRNHTITELTVYDATIGQKGVLVLTRALQQNENLQLLILEERFKIGTLAELPYNEISRQRVKFLSPTTFSY